MLPYTLNLGNEIVYLSYANDYFFAVPRPLRLSKPGVNKRRDSESQLQSLVARVQCGDWPPLLTSLLRDRVKEAGSEVVKEKLSPRSIYRETLFLNMIVSTSLLEIGTYSETSDKRHSERGQTSQQRTSQKYSSIYTIQNNLKGDNLSTKDKTLGPKRVH